MISINLRRLIPIHDFDETRIFLNSLLHDYFSENIKKIK